MRLIDNNCSDERFLSHFTLYKKQPKTAQIKNIQIIDNLLSVALANHWIDLYNLRRI